MELLWNLKVEILMFIRISLNALTLLEGHPAFKNLISGRPPTWKSQRIWQWSGKSQGKWKKSGRICFACDVLPWLWWSQNKHSLTAWVLLSADDMSVMDW